MTPFSELDLGRTSVIDTRQRGGGIVRRRKIDGTNIRITTFEAVVAPPFISVATSDGHRERFDHSRLRADIADACLKLRPTKEETGLVIEEATNRIVLQLLATISTDSPPIRAAEIKRASLDVLWDLDPRAFERYAHMHLAGNIREVHEIMRSKADAEGRKLVGFEFLWEEREGGTLVDSFRRAFPKK